MKDIFTIGYTAFEINKFVDIMKQYGISCVIDVRSAPFSKFYTNYNIENIKKTLNGNNIYYRNYKDEFGARQTDTRYFSNNGCLDFELFTKSDSFISGYNKLIDGMKQGYTFALMCAEKDPLNCHRTIMVSREFHKFGYAIKHILENCIYQTQNDIENRMLNIYFPDRNQRSLFNDELSEDELINQCYKKKNIEIGYREDED